ncbi:hypothetical protein CTI14_68570, partial [Methylobacterium radiotolerans]
MPNAYRLLICDDDAILRDTLPRSDIIACCTRQAAPRPPAARTGARTMPNAYRLLICDDDAILRDTL